eukprot:403357986
MSYLHYILYMKNYPLLRSFLLQDSAKDEIEILTDKYGNNVGHIVAYLQDEEIFELFKEFDIDIYDHYNDQNLRPIDIARLYHSNIDNTLSVSNSKSKLTSNHSHTENQSKMEQLEEGELKSAQPSRNDEKSSLIEDKSQTLNDEEYLQQQVPLARRNKTEKQLIQAKVKPHKHKRHEQPKQHSIKLPMIMPNSDKYKGFGSNTAYLIDYNAITDVNQRFDRLLSAQNQPRAHLQQNNPTQNFQNQDTPNFHNRSILAADTQNNANFNQINANSNQNQNYYQIAEQDSSGFGLIEQQSFDQDSRLLQNNDNSGKNQNYQQDLLK